MTLGQKTVYDEGQQPVEPKSRLDSFSNQNLEVSTEELLKRLDENTQQNFEKIMAYNGQLNGVADTIKERVASVIKKQQREFVMGYEVWVRKQDQIFKDLIKKLNDKINFQDAKDRRIAELLIQMK